MIDQYSLDATGGVEFRNVASSEGTGAELELDVRPSDALAIRSPYAYQHADAEPSNERLPNSPEQIATVAATYSGGLGIRGTVMERYEAGRRTLQGPSTPAFLRTDANVALAIPPSRNADLGLHVTNLFNTYSASPAGLEHVQASIPQGGRRISAYLSWHF